MNMPQTVSAGPQMVTCESCQAVFKSRRSDGKVARFCSRACWLTGYRGPKHHEWQGSTDYWATHARVRRARGAAKSYSCEHCGEPARDWALSHGKSGLSPDDFVPLCRKCHVTYDGPNQPPHHGGGANPAAKLTAEQVREIRALRGRVPVSELAATYGVTRQTIYRIMTGKNWAAATRR